MTGATRRSYQGFWEQKNRQASGVFSGFHCYDKKRLQLRAYLNRPNLICQQKRLSIFDLDGRFPPELVFRHFPGPREKGLGNVAHPGAKEPGQPLARIGSVLKDESLVPEFSIFEEVFHHRPMNPIGFAKPYPGPPLFPSWQTRMSPGSDSPPGSVSAGSLRSCPKPMPHSLGPGLPGLPSPERGGG